MMYCVAYPAGAYGNFIGWTLEWLQGKYPVDYRPFVSNTTFNSHKWTRVFTDRVEKACELSYNGILVHPMNEGVQSLQPRIELLHTVYDKVLYLYPKLDNFIWIMNNCHSKATKNGLLNEQYIKDLLKVNEDKWEGTNLWELREQLSFLLHDIFVVGSGINEVNNLNKQYVKTVPISNLRDNFQFTVCDMANWLELEVVRNSDEINSLHRDWLQREIFVNKDKLISDLVDAIINNKNLFIDGLSLIDESQIQRQLRTKGYEIKCYGLNEWPKTTTQLRELIYETDV